jgi:hypothetical protein
MTTPSLIFLSPGGRGLEVRGNGHPHPGPLSSREREIKEMTSTGLASGHGLKKLERATSRRVFFSHQFLLYDVNDPLCPVKGA